MDIAAQKRKELKMLFPEIFSETRKDDGVVVEAIDFERFKAALGEFSNILDRQRERYGMVWPGKNECQKIIQQPSLATLKPARDESVNFDETENLFIEGDNLEVLKLLQKSYYGKVKMIYIDPPYNTGKDFVYPDNYSETLETYLKYAGLSDMEGKKWESKVNSKDSGRFHTQWLNMMYPRLYLARNILREDGVIFVSIGEEELSNLEFIMKSVFGEENEVAIVSRLQKRGGNKGNHFNPVCDYILAFSKNLNKLPFFTDNVDTKIYKKTETMGDRTGEKYAEVVIYMPNLDYRPNQRFTVEAPDGSTITTPEGKSFRWTEERFRKEQELGNIVFKKSTRSKLIKMDGSKAAWIPYQKRFLKDTLNNETARPNNFLENFQNMKGSKELADLGIPFDYPKPSSLVRHLAFLSKTRNSDLVLDFFAGSCTTAHAVFNLNKEDGGNRRFIMVQLPEPCPEVSKAAKAGYKTIADIGKERIRRVIKKIISEQEGILDLEGKPKPDLGFKVFQLDRSNFKFWDGEPKDDPNTIRKQIELHIHHINPKASQEDILYELLLKAGFPLTTKIEKRTMADKNVFAVENGALLICLEKSLTPELIRAMANANPLQVICLDEGFKGNDQLKTNAAQTFKSRSQGESEHQQIVFRTV